jgi:hypothetical protein
MKSVAAFTFEQFHNKKNIGSTKIRIKNLIKYWPELHLYKFGEKPDVMIFQKVYRSGETFRSAAYTLPGEMGVPSILDICDADWLGQGAITKACFITETARKVDAVVTSTEALAEFIRQLTDKPVVCIPDRFVIDDFPALKNHTQPLKKAVWFGYSHNAELLQYAIPAIERHKLDFTIISNDDPRLPFKYNFKLWSNDSAYDIIRQQDIAILPKGTRPQDRFKSNNRPVQAILCGVPVATTAEDIERFESAPERNKSLLPLWQEYRKEYDVRKSVSEYKDLIGDILQNNEYKCQ